jgi:hypothetical protein
MRSRVSFAALFGPVALSAAVISLSVFFQEWSAGEYEHISGCAMDRTPRELLQQGSKLFEPPPLSVTESLCSLSLWRGAGYLLVNYPISRHVVDV